MKTASAVPFRRASPDRLIGGQWEARSADQPMPLPHVLAGLDYGTSLRLRRELIIDIDGVRADCGLSKEAPLLAAASWVSSGTMLRRNLASAALDEQGNACLLELSGVVSGDSIAGSLRIDTSILIARQHVDGDPLAARLAGSVLLQESQTIELDSSEAFFPVEVADFSKGFAMNPDAGWRLSWNVHALDQPFLGSVRLFINAAHQRVARAVSTDSPSPDASAIRSAIYFDVARSLILSALGHEEFVERNGDYAKGSAGRVICSMIQMVFPGDSLNGLASAAEQRPEHFSTDLQGRLRLFWVEP
jgi:hypothetical protein